MGNPSRQLEVSPPQGLTPRSENDWQLATPQQYKTTLGFTYTDDATRHEWGPHPFTGFVYLIVNLYNEVFTVVIFEFICVHVYIYMRIHIYAYLLYTHTSLFSYVCLHITHMYIYYMYTHFCA